MKADFSSNLINFVLLPRPIADDIFGESHYNRLPSNHEEIQHTQRRFKSSLLGIEIPYGSGSSRSSVLTQAQRKEYPPTLSRNEINNSHKFITNKDRGM